MSERETRDFMSVDSFSQLPFIRSAPPVRDKRSSSAAAAGSAIRLFGIEFPQEADAAEAESSSKDNTSGGSNGNGGNANASSGSGGGDSGRKFECHYCCRNFPTSQALGGHQNAHKRERQHAKRAYLQSAMAAHHHQAHGYGLMNYHHLGSMASTARFGIAHAFVDPPPPSHYPSWSSTGAGGALVGARFYGGLGSVSQPINGSPLPGMWRISAVQGGGGLPPTQRDRSTALLSLGGDESRPTVGMIGVGGGGGGGGIAGSSSSSSSPHDRLVYDSAAGVQDHLSLDLHL